MQFSRFAPIAATAALLFTFACDKTPGPLSPTDEPFAAGGNADASKSSGDNKLVRWDVGLFDGSSSATASSNARITFTGSGTFRTHPKNREHRHVTGGGTWETFNPSGISTASGRYTVTALLSFHFAPGTVPPGVIPRDVLPDNTAARAGLAFLRIRYSDGTHGILVVSCRLPFGSPPDVAEGISASKGFVDFWRMEDPDPTLFQIVKKRDNKHDDDDNKNDDD
jgi:hypothetical protein